MTRTARMGEPGLESAEGALPPRAMRAPRSIWGKMKRGARNG